MNFEEQILELGLPGEVHPGKYTPVIYSLAAEFPGEFLWAGQLPEEPHPAQYTLLKSPPEEHSPEMQSPEKAHSMRLGKRDHSQIA